MLHTWFFWKCYDKSHRRKQIKGKTDLKIMAGCFLPCKGHICTLKHLGEGLWEAAGAEWVAACSTSLLLWGTLTGDNSSWAALSYVHVPPASCQASVNQQVLQCYFSIPWGWKWGLFPKGGTYLSQLQLFAPQVPPPCP